MSVWACIHFFFSFFFGASSRAPLSLHKSVCLGRCRWECTCMIVSVCLREENKWEEEKRSGWWEMAHSEETEETGREREKWECYGSSSISSQLSGLWATQLPEPAAALPSPELRIHYVRHRRICFNSPLTPQAARLSKSGLNKPRGCAPDKQTNMQRRPLCIRRSLAAPRGGWGAHRCMTRRQTTRGRVWKGDTETQEYKGRRGRREHDSLCEHVFIFEKQKHGCGV